MNFGKTIAKRFLLSFATTMGVVGGFLVMSDIIIKFGEKLSKQEKETSSQE